MKKVVHTFVAPIEGFETYTDEILKEWKNSEIGKFVMTHSNPQSEFIQEPVRLEWHTTMCKIVANFDQETYVWYKLKFE